MDLLGVEKVGRAMATYTADIDWKLADGDDFLKGRYSRGHTLTFDGGTVVPASASPPSASGP